MNQCASIECSNAQLSIHLEIYKESIRIESHKHTTKGMEQQSHRVSAINPTPTPPPQESATKEEGSFRDAIVDPSSDERSFRHKHLFAPVTRGEYFDATTCEAIPPPTPEQVVMENCMDMLGCGYHLKSCRIYMTLNDWVVGPPNPDSTIPQHTRVPQATVNGICWIEESAVSVRFCFCRCCEKKPNVFSMEQYFDEFFDPIAAENDAKDREFDTNPVLDSQDTAETEKEADVEEEDQDDLEESVIRG